VITAEIPTLGQQTMSGKLEYGRRTGSLDGQLDGIRIAQGTAGVRGGWRDGRWRAELSVDGVAIESLVQLSRDWKVAVPELSATGLVSLLLDVRGTQASLEHAQVDAKVTALTLNNQEGSLASDKLSFTLKGNARRKSSDWAFQVETESALGQVYVQPIFLDLATHPLQGRAQGTFESGILHFTHFDVAHRNVAHVAGSGELRLGQKPSLQALALNIESLQFPGAYATYFQPLLLETSFKSLQTAGVISGRVNVAATAPQRIDLEFDNVTVDDGAGNLALHALNGKIHWRERSGAEASEDDDSDLDASPDTSLLSWQQGTLLGLAVGSGGLKFSAEGRQVRLLEPARIPILDGAIELESFRVRNAGLPTVAFIVDATIQPISVQLLSRAFGWPEFGGQVGGVISKLRMRDGIVTLGTTLQAQMLGGSVTVSDLRLEQALSPWPRFSASIGLENLDLELITGAFSFGRITGRLSGAINNLQLFNWTAVAFDARLSTPAGDRSRHRISQRAVENIGSIGGGGAGVTAALSSGFLRFFEDFNYDTLGISCRLENDVCHMDGVAAAPNGGYYLVKGKGLPRIDVIGNSRRVDWPRLVQQLIAATQSEGPVVR
jgi:hypothetical protein